VNHFHHLLIHVQLAIFPTAFQWRGATLLKLYPFLVVGGSDTWLFMSHFETGICTIIMFAIALFDNSFHVT
jgi:hypothetical protein